MIGDEKEGVSRGEIKREIRREKHNLIQLEFLCVFR